MRRLRSKSRRSAESRQRCKGVSDSQIKQEGASQLRLILKRVDQPRPDIFVGKIRGFRGFPKAGTLSST